MSLGREVITPLAHQPLHVFACANTLPPPFGPSVQAALPFRNIMGEDGCPSRALECVDKPRLGRGETREKPKSPSQAATGAGFGPLHQRAGRLFIDLPTALPGQGSQRGGANAHTYVFKAPFCKCLWSS